MASLLLLVPARRLLEDPESLLHLSNSSSNATIQNTSAYGLTSRFNPSMAIIIVVLLSAFFFMGFFSVYIRRCTSDTQQFPRNNNNNNPARRPDSSSHRSGVDKSIVDSLPIVVYSASKGSKVAKENTECVVCLSEFEENEALRLLPKCGHVFHQDCIDMWLFSHNTCPLCRRSVLPEKVRSFRDFFTFGGSNRSGRDDHSGVLDRDRQDQESLSERAGEIQGASPSSNAPTPAGVRQNPSPRSRSQLGEGRKLSRSNSTGHASIKLQPPLSAPREDEESGEQSAVFRMPLLASDFHRSRSVTAMTYHWHQENERRAQEEDLTSNSIMQTMNPTEDASSSSTQPPLSSISSMRRTFLRLVGIEKSPDLRYRIFPPLHS